MTILDAIAPDIICHPRMIVVLLWALVPTIVIEMCVLLFLRERRKAVLLGSIAINCATNIPLSTWAILTYPSWGQVLVAELLICIVEAALYRLLRCSWPQAAAYAFLANAISFLTGLVVELACLVANIDIPLLY